MVELRSGSDGGYRTDKSTGKRATKRNEVSRLHSINSSVRGRDGSGIASASVPAVLRLVARSNSHAGGRELEQYPTKRNRPLTQLCLSSLRSLRLRNPCMGLLLSRPFGPPRVDDLRRALLRARPSRHNLVFGRVDGTRNHDAVMRIDSEAPGRRAHSLPRHGSHGLRRVTATSDRHARRGRSLPAAGKQTKVSVGALMGPAAGRRRSAVARSSPSATARSVACVPRRRSSSCVCRRARRRCVACTTARERCPSGT